MRGFVVLAIAIGLVVYGFSRLSAPPVAPAMVAQLPPSKPPLPVVSPPPRQAAPQTQQARSAAPLDITPSAQQPAKQPSRQASPGQPEPSKSKRAAEVLTAAAIAALIVEESRRAYHAGGRPCACPDDTMRNGRACGGRSAYSRPGGAAPLCYPTDVTAEMIKNYRAQVAQR